MPVKFVFTALLLLITLVVPVDPVGAETAQTAQEKSMSETLDLWREGRHEQLYERLARRGKTSREQFIRKMKDTSIRPACCFQKLENFKVLNEKRTQATVYARIGLEGSPGSPESSTREFKLSLEENIWKMQLSDVLALSGASGKKGRHTSRKIHNSYKQH